MQYRIPSTYMWVHTLSLSLSLSLARSLACSPLLLFVYPGHLCSTASTSTNFCNERESYEDEGSGLKASSGGASIGAGHELFSKFCARNEKLSHMIAPISSTCSASLPRLISNFQDQAQGRKV